MERERDMKGGREGGREREKQQQKQDMECGVLSALPPKISIIVHVC